MTSILRICERPLHSSIPGLFYWVRWGYSFFEAFSDDLMSSGMPHRFVDAPDPDYGYGTVDDYSIEEREVYCDQCHGYRYSIVDACQLGEVRAQSVAEFLELADTCLLHESAKRKVRDSRITGIRFTPAVEQSGQSNYWIMQPDKNVHDAPIRYTTEHCGKCNSPNVQCPLCHSFATSCGSCGETLRYESVNEREYAAVELGSWDGRDVLGLNGHMIVTGRCLKTWLEAGLFGFTFGPCGVDTQALDSMAIQQQELDSHIRIVSC